MTMPCVERDGETLSREVLHHFGALGVLPVIGVNDPALLEKLQCPTDYGWGARTELTLTSAGSAWRGLRRWRLVPPVPYHWDGGQSVIMSESGDIFLETAGPWGVVYMHRGADGRVTTRTHGYEQRRDA